MTIHFIEVDYGDEGGKVFLETNVAKASFKDAVRIVTDNSAYVVGVIAVDLEAGTCKDVSADVARAICDTWDREDVPDAALLDFLQDHNCVPDYHDPDDAYEDPNAEHRIGTYEAGVGKWR